MRLIDLDDDRHIYIGVHGEYERWNIDPDVPVIDPERKHGYWRYAEFLYGFICSNCKRAAISCYDYCPCCGAEMRVKKDE